MIPSSQWRQDLYDYVEVGEAVLGQIAEDPEDYESFATHEQAFYRLDLLSDLARMAHSTNFEGVEIQEIILECCGKFGPLPEEFAVLIEAGKPDRILPAC